MLDPIEPTHFYPMFADIMAELQQSGGLDKMRCLGGHILIALDGTEYHCSRDVHCPNCSHHKCGKDKIEYFHTMPAATVVAPGNNRAVPLKPEFIVPQDGMRNRTARATPLAAEWPRMARSIAGSIRFIPVTACSPASRSARPCWPRGPFHLRLQAGLAPRD